MKKHLVSLSLIFLSLGNLSVAQPNPRRSMLILIATAVTSSVATYHYHENLQRFIESHIKEPNLYHRSKEKLTNAIKAVKNSF